MKSLNDYIKESILSDWEGIDVEKDVKKSITEDFIKSNYKITGDIQFDHYNNGKWVVNIDGHVKFINMDLKKLTNGLFEFGKVGKNFYCHNCKSLKTLEGAPEKVGYYLDCDSCKKLTSFKGLPKEIGDSFYCRDCKKLTDIDCGYKPVVKVEDVHFQYQISINI